ncbi:MAG TPA: hypothetical protein VK600_01460 [Candidatus Saccharimonadales bacterium]|nr:hypothetical protein [Candidatus Saccharimonadales bacterium]
MPTTRGLGALLLIAVLGAGCAASGASPSGSNAPASKEATTPASGTASNGSASASVLPAASSVGLPDGIYTAGRFSARLTGVITAVLDLALQPAGSMTSQGSTMLTYQGAHGTQLVTVALVANGPSTVTFSGSNITAAGISAEGCSITITNAGSSRLTGSIDCHAMTAINASGSVVGTLYLKGTFEATR